MHEGLDRWAALARETDDDGYAAAMAARDARRAPDATATEAFLGAMPPEKLWPGLDRYWSQAERVDSGPWARRSSFPGRRSPARGLGGAWRVIVRNDDHNTFDHVAHTLARYIPGVTVDRGYAIADRIHNSGLAIVWSGHGSRPSSTGSSSATRA